MMSAPVARTASGFIALTVAAVPTGMNAGVRISPRRIAMRPARALPSAASIVKAKRGASEAIDEREAGGGVGGDGTGGRDAVVIDRIAEARRQAVGDRRLEAAGQQDAGRGRIDDDLARGAGVGDDVGVLGELEPFGDAPV